MTMWSSLHTTRRTMLSLFQREIGLFQYYGPVQYWIRRNSKNKNNIKNNSNNNSNSNSNSNSINNSNNQALTGMTNVARVPFMVTQAQRLRLQQELGYTRQDIQHLTPMDVTLILQHQVLPEERESRLELLLQTTTNTTTNTTTTNTTAAATTKVWYQVLEECETTGKFQVIGLYSDRDEATLVRNTKEELAQKHLTRVPTYIIREQEKSQ